MPNRILTYRNDVNGAVGDYPEELAQHFPNLIEVPAGTKPLAYLPIPQEQIDALNADPTDILDPDEDPEDFVPDNDSPDAAGKVVDRRKK